MKKRERPLRLKKRPRTATIPNRLRVRSSLRIAIPHCMQKTRSSHTRPLLAFLIGFLLLQTIAYASAPAYPASTKEKPYALIYGTVWGPDSRPVYGVKVKIRRASDKKARWELYSNHLGEFTQRVPAGKADYVIWAEPTKAAKSNKRMSLRHVTEVTVHVENDERVDTGLHLTE